MNDILHKNQFFRGNVEYFISFDESYTNILVVLIIYKNKLYKQIPPLNCLTENIGKLI